MQIRVFTDAVRAGAIPHKVIRVQHCGAFLVFAAHQAEDLISVFDLNRVHDRKIRRIDLDICFSDRDLAVRIDSLITGHMNLGIALDGQVVPDIYTVILTDCLQLAAGHFHRTVRADAIVVAACINASIGNA